MPSFIDRVMAIGAEIFSPDQTAQKVTVKVTPSSAPGQQQQPKQTSPSTPQQQQVQQVQPPVAPKPPVAVDSAFFIGKGHEVCQDYVTSSSNAARGFVVLADGCSSSPETDVGARLLVKISETHIPRVPIIDPRAYAAKIENYYLQVAQESRDLALRLGLNETCLDATLLGIQADAKGNFIATCYGDGVVALARRDGLVEIYSSSYTEGYPRYPSYAISPARTEAFERVPNNRKKITYHLLSGRDSVQQSYESSTKLDCYIGNRSRYKWVAVMSDGVHSFTRWMQTETGRWQEGIPVEEVLTKMLDFKGVMTGEFTKRRMKKFLHECEKAGWEHHDDLSIGVIYLGDD